MKAQPDPISLIRELAGDAVAKAVQAEYAGEMVYIPSPVVQGTYFTVTVPRFRIKGKFKKSFGSKLRMVAVTAAANMIANFNEGGAVVEVDLRDVDLDFIREVNAALSKGGCVTVVGVSCITDAAKGGAA